MCVHVHDEVLSDDVPAADSSSNVPEGLPVGDPFHSTVCHAPEMHQGPELVGHMKMQLRERLGFGRLEACADR